MCVSIPHQVAQPHVSTVHNTLFIADAAQP